MSLEFKDGSLATDTSKEGVGKNAVSITQRVDVPLFHALVRNVMERLAQENQTKKDALAARKEIYKKIMRQQREASQRIEETDVRIPPAAETITNHRVNESGVETIEGATKLTAWQMQLLMKANARKEKIVMEEKAEELQLRELLDVPVHLKTSVLRRDRMITLVIGASGFANTTITCLTDNRVKCTTFEGKTFTCNVGDPALRSVYYAHLGVTEFLGWDFAKQWNPHNGVSHEKYAPPPGQSTSEPPHPRYTATTQKNPDQRTSGGPGIEKSRPI